MPVFWFDPSVYFSEVSPAFLSSAMFLARRAQQENFELTLQTDFLDRRVAKPNEKESICAQLFLAEDREVGTITQVDN